MYLKVKDAIKNTTVHFEKKWNVKFEILFCRDILVE